MMGHGFFGWMWLWPLLIIGAIIACVAIIGGWGRQNRFVQDGATSDGLRILKTRYAKGEISQEEFERMRQILQ